MMQYRSVMRRCSLRDGRISWEREHIPWWSTRSSAARIVRRSNTNLHGGVLEVRVDRVIDRVLECLSHRH